MNLNVYPIYNNQLTAYERRTSDIICTTLAIKEVKNALLKHLDVIKRYHYTMLYYDLIIILDTLLFICNTKSLYWYNEMIKNVKRCTFTKAFDYIEAITNLNNKERKNIP